MNDSKQPKPIKTSELILRQIHNVRRCFTEFEQDAIEFAESKNTFERDEALALSLIHISEPTRPCGTSRMPSSA